MFLNKFKNIRQIPEFEKLIATIQSREISASIILQAKSQLKTIYKDNADTIEDKCDTILFLGYKEKSTLKEISESLGKETIDSFNTSTNRGQSESYGMNYQKLGKKLKSQDELAVVMKIIMYVKSKNKKFRQSEEYVLPFWAVKKILSHIWTIQILKITSFSQKRIFSQWEKPLC